AQIPSKRRRRFARVKSKGRILRGTERLEWSIPQGGACVRFIKAISLAACALAARPCIGENPDRPSRKPFKDCAWEKASEPAVGLEGWVQRCAYGFRKIDFLFEKGSLAMRFSDGGSTPESVVDVFDLKLGESYEVGMRRLFAERTDKDIVARCVLATYSGDKPPRGVKRYTFLPNAAYLKELERKADPNEVPDPPCGDWGTAPDGIQYFETHPSGNVRKVLFVRIGQDEPLFDEKTLKLLPAR